MTNYLVIKEETCTKCNGTWETKNPNYAEDYKYALEMYGEDAPSHYFPKEKLTCTSCKEGKIRTEISLETAMKNILQNKSTLANEISNRVWR